MISHTEAREAVAAELLRQYQVEYQGGRIEEWYENADAILARLGELGYGDIDQMSRIATSEHFAHLHKFKERLTSEGAVEAAAKAVWPYMGCEPCEPARHKIPWSGDSTAANKLEKDFARHAVQAAIAAAIAKAARSPQGGSLLGTTTPFDETQAK